VHDLRDLLAKKPSATGGRMANVLRIDTEFFQLSGSDFSQTRPLACTETILEKPSAPAGRQLVLIR
jgi:hypothetical protein